jgi:hypothetical protein
MSGELGGIRTHDPRLKRALLYQLSYELSPGCKFFEIRKLLPEDRSALELILASVAEMWPLCTESTRNFDVCVGGLPNLRLGNAGPLQAVLHWAAETRPGFPL